MAPTERSVVGTVLAGVGGGTTRLFEVGTSYCNTKGTACCVRCGDYMKAQYQQVIGGFYSRFLCDVIIFQNQK